MRNRWRRSPRPRRPTGLPAARTGVQATGRGAHAADPEGASVAGVRALQHSQARLRLLFGWRATNGAAYKRWINNFATAIGNEKSSWYSSPMRWRSGLPDETGAEYSLRLDSLRRRPAGPESAGALYIDAGNSDWAARVRNGKEVAEGRSRSARGFALNVSNYQTTTASIAYGNRLARLLGRKHYIVDTSRTASGPGAAASTGATRPIAHLVRGRPRIRPLGSPTLSLDQDPGESDGTCKGGPPAGQWWPEYALGLAQRASW